MNVFFCTRCDAGLVFGRRRCRQCGARAGTGQAALPSSGRRRFGLPTLSDFFASQASLTLATLLVLLGLGIALAPVGWSYAWMQLARYPAVMHQAGKSLASHARTLADPASRCQIIEVFMSEMATVGEVTALLASLGPKAVRGPDEKGAYELTVPEQAAPAVAESLGKAEGTVEGFFLKTRCGQS